ncbi:MAG: SdrD B-like domain-containing protein, partial [Tepidisphaeraceae bacterium]
MNKRNLSKLMESLESRRLFSTVFLVTSTADTGAGSLRQAILNANSSPGGDEIHFNIGSGAKTITPKSALPRIDDSVEIDGTTQPGYAGKPIIEINGAQTNNADGILIYFGDHTTLRGLVINRFDGNGVADVSAGFNTIQNCYIGTNVAGNADLGNGKSGISLFSKDNLVGGTLASQRNVISGNGDTSDFIGHGIVTLTAGGGNVIQGNYIGVAADGSTPLGNSACGIAVSDFGGLIGGDEAGAGNVIAFNGSAGISMGPSGKDYAISENSIYGNVGLGIDLRSSSSSLPDGSTLNDLLDADAGGNKLQNTPVLTSAITGQGVTALSGKLHSEKNKVYRVEIFRNPVGDPSAEGKQFVTSFEVTTDSFGNGNFKVNLPNAISPGVVLTATATDPDNNTSEFSSARKVTAKPISGVVFNDVNSNGVRDNGEVGLGGWRVYVDSDKDGVWDASEKSRLTDSDGKYVFDDVLGTSLRLGESVQKGWRQTYPGTAFHEGDLSASSRNFGNTTSCVVRGTVFFDADQDGVRDAGESGIEGWRVFIDKNGNGKWDPTESSRITNSRGEWRFAGLKAATYNFRVEQLPDFVQTAPVSGVFTAKLSARPEPVQPPLRR